MTTRKIGWSLHTTFFAVFGALALAGAGCEKVETKQEPKPIPKKVEKRARIPLFEIPRDMRVVRAGEFWMGCKPDLDDGCEEPEKPGRQVHLDIFFIDRNEVTVSRYAACVAAGACTEEGLKMPSFGGKEQTEWAWACNWGKKDREDHPINCLNWKQADAYCRWATKRLPTEAEWEKAARGTDGRKYAWGNQEYAAMAKAGKKVANIADESEKRRDPAWTVAAGYDDGYTGTAPVGSFPEGASPCGALDMTGNVLEWVADWYDESYFGAAPKRNPPGPAKGEHHVARGGAWYGEPSTTRLGLRWVDPLRRIVAVGVRCAKSTP